VGKKPARTAAGRTDGERPRPATRPEPLVDPLRAGMLIAAVIAGPPLWSLYRAGNLDLGTALLNWGLVAAGCGAGLAAVDRLIADYRIQADRDRRVRELMDCLEGAVHESLPIPASPQPRPTEPTPQTGPPRPPTSPQTPARP
jgi:hypothetical protein